MKNELLIFEGHEVEIFELNGQILFNANHVAEVLDIKNVRDNVSKMNGNQALRLTNSAVGKADIRKLNNAGENFLTESGVYKLVFKSHKPNAEKFTDWIADDVLPTLRKTGKYEMPKTKHSNERLASVNNAVKILTPILEKAGCNNKIQLLTVKSLYEKAGVEIPVEIEADEKYFDTKYIARQCGLYTKSNKPAYQAVCEIIKRLNVDESLYTDTWETNGKWQGTVRKYAPSIINMVKQWYTDNNYPREIEFTQCNGEKKSYHVIWKNAEVA